MRLDSLLLGAAAPLAFAFEATRSAKRGLVFTPNQNYPEDNTIWTQSGTGLTWYYNYQEIPSPVFKGIPQSTFEFVPMMWGLNQNQNLDDTSFYTSVKKLIDQGINITHAMGFNEPDGPAQYGGSDLKPKDAARGWVANFIPLQQLGVKVGLPACTGSPGGLPWLKQFLGNCSALISKGGATKNCTYDFLPIHWYDNFGGLASHIGERVANFPNTSIWVTEYAYAHQELTATQEFYNMSAEYLDRLAYVERYTYFGAFRSKTSNVGVNVPFLNNDGKLTDIGSWYMGFGKATGVLPTSGNPSLPNAAPANRSPVVIAFVASFVGASFLSLL